MSRAILAIVVAFYTSSAMSPTVRSPLTPLDVARIVAVSITEALRK